MKISPQKTKFLGYKVKPWRNEPASGLKWTQVELARRLSLGGKMDSQVFSQVIQVAKRTF